MGLYVGNTKYKPIIGGVGYKVVRELPYDAEVEYLQSDGRCVIDLGIKGNSYLNYEVKFTWNTNYSWEYVIGGQTSDSSNRFSLMVGDKNNRRLFFNNGTSAEQKYQLTAVAFNNPITIKKENNRIYLNGGTSAIVTFTNSTYETPSTLYLLSCNEPSNNSVYRGPSHGRIYFIKIGTLDLIPVRVGQVGYMYDKVSGQLFGNAGSGNFILGNDKN